MEFYFIFLLFIIVMFAWYKVILYVAKHTVGKDASLLKIMLFLILAGPIGWGVVIIMIATELVDILYKKIFKK